MLRDDQNVADVIFKVLNSTATLLNGYFSNKIEEKKLNSIDEISFWLILNYDKSPYTFFLEQLQKSTVR